MEALNDAKPALERETPTPSRPPRSPPWARSFPEEEMRQMLHRHLDLTREELGRRGSPATMSGDIKRHRRDRAAGAHDGRRVFPMASPRLAAPNSVQTPAGRMVTQPSRPAVPIALDQLESGAEDIIDLINNEDWTRAQSMVAAMEKKPYKSPAVFSSRECSPISR